ncbi:MAG: aminotransferase class V-fold PLP-dependent enzyme [Cyclobacteriaceae bacterium]
MNNFNIIQIRKDTRYCEDKIFLNSAGASLMPSVVVDHMKEYLDEEEKLGGYKLVEVREKEISEFYTEVGKLLNCQAKNVAFSFNATDAYSKALSAIEFESGDVILTTDDDYVSNQIAFMSLEKRHGVRFVKAKNLGNGDLDLVDFEKLIKTHQPKLVAVTHIPNNSGLIQDVEAIGDLCEKYDVLYIVDACQSAGQIPLDVKKIKCDFLSATGRKFLRGPRGTGFLYVSDKVLDSTMAPLFMDLRGATWTEKERFQISETAKRFEIWELPYAGLIGLKEAVKYATNIDLDVIRDRNSQLLERLAAKMKQVGGIKRFDKGSEKANIFTFQKEGVSQEALTGFLDKHHVFYSVATIHVARIDFEKKGIDWAVRISPHYFNTEEEMDRLATIVDHAR